MAQLKTKRHFNTKYCNLKSYKLLFFTLFATLFWLQLSWETFAHLFDSANTTGPFIKSVFGLSVIFLTSRVCLVCQWSWRYCRPEFGDDRPDVHQRLHVSAPLTVTKLESKDKFVFSSRLASEWRLLFFLHVSEDVRLRRALHKFERISESNNN